MSSGLIRGELAMDSEGVLACQRCIEMNDNHSYIPRDAIPATHEERNRMAGWTLDNEIM